MKKRESILKTIPSSARGAVAPSRDASHHVRYDPFERCTAVPSRHRHPRAFTRLSPRAITSSLVSRLSRVSLALGPKAPVPSDLDARPRLDVMAPLSAPGTISKIIVTPSVVLGVCDGCAATRDARATDRSRPEPRRAEAARPPRATRARDTRRSRRANDDARDGVTDRGARRA